MQVRAPHPWHLLDRSAQPRPADPGLRHLVVQMLPGECCCPCRTCGLLTNTVAPNRLGLSSSKLQAATFADNTFAYGAGLTYSVAGTSATFSVQAIDKFMIEQVGGATAMFTHNQRDACSRCPGPPAMVISLVPRAETLWLTEQEAGGEDALLTIAVQEGTADTR